MPTFQSRHTCEAIQFKGHNGSEIVDHHELRAWIKTHAPDAVTELIIPEQGRPHLVIRTDRSSAAIYAGAWIVSIGDGQFAGMDEREFEKEYQLVQDEPRALRAFESDIIKFLEHVPDESRMILAGQTGGFAHVMVVPQFALDATPKEWAQVFTSHVEDVPSGAA